MLEVKRLGGSHRVYLVDDERSNKKFILKSFRDPGVPPSKAHARMEREYKRQLTGHAMECLERLKRLNK